MYAYPFNPRSFSSGSGINSALDAEGRAALHLAAARGDREEARRLLRAGAQPNRQDRQGRTPLFEAVARQDRALVELFLDRGATFRVLDAEGRTPLMHAMRCGAGPDFLEALLALGENMDFPSPAGGTALHFAALDGRADLVPWFAARGVSPDRRDDAGTAPLHIAVQRDDAVFVRALLEAGARPDLRDDKIRTPLHFAAGAGNLEIIDILLSCPAAAVAVDAYRTYDDGFTPLHTAVHAGKAEAAARLVAAGADVNLRDRQNRHSLFIAAEEGRLDLCGFLIGKGADVHKAPRSSFHNAHMLHWIGDRDYEGILALLCAAGAEIDAVTSHGLTPLNKACYTCDTRRAVALLAQGADPNRADENGLRPIDAFFARQMGDDIVLLSALLARGADPGLAPAPQVLDSPLHVAAREGRVNLARLLLRHGAPLNAQDRTQVQRTPLHRAVEYGNAEMVFLLCAAGAEVFAADYMGRTPLHMAAYLGMTEIAVLLASAPGVQVNGRDGNGATPLLGAVRRGRGETASWLLSRGADPRIADEHGLLPIHAAAGCEGDEMLRRLAQVLTEKDGWQARTLSGDTPLHIAARAGNLGGVKYLVEQAGVDVFTKNIAQDTPRTAAARAGSAEVAEYLGAVESRNRPQKPPGPRPPAI